MLNQKPEILCIIPARGGSKGIPRKNIVNLCGWPLIAYTIAVALRSRLIARTVVSTDDPEIADISRHYGAEVPFLRPKDLAQDKSSISEVVEHCLDELKKEDYYPDCYAIMYPTHLFRNPELVDGLLSKIIQGYTTVQTVKRVGTQKKSYFKLDNDKRLSPLNYKNQKNILNYYRPYGILTAAYKTDLYFGQYIFPIEDKIMLIDIDKLTDLYLAENIIKNNLFDFSL